MYIEIEGRALLKETKKMKNQYSIQQVSDKALEIKRANISKFDAIFAMEEAALMAKSLMEECFINDVKKAYIAL